MGTSKASELPEDTSHGFWVICPWCGAKYGDAWEWCKQEPREETCEGCGKQYTCWADVSVEYRAAPILAATPDVPNEREIGEQHGNR